MAVEISTPEHSFIQFASAIQFEVDETTCVEQRDLCLPVNQVDDIDFQLFITGTDDEIPSEGEYYLVLLNSCDLNDQLNVYGDNTFASITWAADATEGPYMEASGIIWGKITKEEFDLDELLEPMDCFRIGIVQIETREACCYSIDTVTFPGTFVITIDVDGQNESAGSVFCESVYDVIDALNTLGVGHFDLDAGDICVESSQFTYETLQIGERFFEPTCDELHDVPVLKYCSNCLQYIPNTCFTTRIKYRCNEDSFGFVYDDTTFYNTVRLPFFLNNPQPKTEENIFRFSDGNYKRLTAKFEKEYEGHVGYISEDWHFKLSIALKHDDVQLLNHEDTTYKQVSQEGIYDIGWKNRPGINIDSAPAEFKVKESPYFNVNSNCV